MTRKNRCYHKGKARGDYKLRLSGSLTELLHQELQQDEVITFVSKNSFALSR